MTQELSDQTLTRVRTAAEFRERVEVLIPTPEALRDFVNESIPILLGPSISHFRPLEGYPGCSLEIFGKFFSEIPYENAVWVGGKEARVVEASPTRLRVITSPETVSGPVRVQIDTKFDESLISFTTRGYPAPGSEEDGPPILFEGRGPGIFAPVPSKGNPRVLVVLCHPSDLSPPNPAVDRTAVENRFSPAWDYFRQASYNRLNPNVEYTDWLKLTGAFTDYVDTTAMNFRPDQLKRLWAECAQWAVDKGFNLDNYSSMAVVMYANKQFLRGKGGSSEQNFAVEIKDTSGSVIKNINVTTTKPLALFAVGEDSNWGRVAHEWAHTILDPGAVLGEDIYSTDLVDPSVATAEEFDLMGITSQRALLSAHFMHQVGWYDPANIKELQWDRNPFREEFNVTAHGLAENTDHTDPNRCHIIRIKVTDGLFYYVEVRQRPDPAATPLQLFDGNIPVTGTANQGGVIVTKVITGEVHMNQEIRLITLLHDKQVLSNGMVATDPARGIKFTVVNDNVQAWPLVCRVRVEWAQNIRNTPGGTFDLQVRPWDENYKSEDIWVDRAPFGTFDTGPGHPGTGDKPRPMEINQIWGRVRNEGTTSATNVRLTFYTTTPPGIGDNGNWAPKGTQLIPLLLPGKEETRMVNWVPLVGEHTCIKVIAETQEGEVSVGNNQGQENVGEFEAPSKSPVQAVAVQLAIRNPRKERSIIFLETTEVPEGYLVHLDHSWVWLDALEEKPMTMTVVPTRPLAFYRELNRTASVRVKGRILRVYTLALPGDGYPPTRFLPIGGFTAKVTPKQGATIRISEIGQDRDSRSVFINGEISPRIGNQPVRVTLHGSAGSRYDQMVLTDGSGLFRATFDPLPSEYEAVAEIINAPEVAQSESNRLFIRVHG